MCRITAAGKEAAVARFLQEFPEAPHTGRDHPALRGCDDIAWADFPGCPTGVPALLRSLLDPTAAAEAERVLCNVLMDSAFALGPAMPAALPFLLRLAADPAVPVRTELVEVLFVVAELSHPVDGSSEQAIRFLGSDRDHPERARCRAVFSEHAEVVRGLLDDRSLPGGLIPPDERASLLKAAAA
ncbi:hypothetical protein A4E84_29460 [Streptomyces qaidamensis]|uniref:Uncharacterized protein n=1 Tax=Streptomyces qaidamensis TaxID=1783515 RepID=A0A143C7T5_9ACTN|nr:hypothetical protein [Streptomyces qaidamensis]AMW13259.1 hypothetical protein A4E84_29460 [Streptomyces qaidamensis]